MKKISCAPYFVYRPLPGRGYSGTFCDNMTQKVRELKADPEEPLMLVTDPDMICALSEPDTG